MEIVIKIEEPLYNTIMCSPNSPTLGWYEIAHGTVLPKGHGDLIDRDELSPKIHGVKSIVAVLEAPAIIEADKDNKKRSDELPSCNNCVHNGEWSSTGNCIKCSCFDRYEKADKG